MSGAGDSLEARLAEVVGDPHVLTDPALVASYGTDWTGRYVGRPRCVVRPAETAEVAAVLRACGTVRVPALVQGGNTGLVGGGVPAGGEVVLSTRRLDHVGAVSAGTVEVGAGATLAAVQQVARAAGWDVGVDLAARDSATIGGMVATNAGGTRVLAHGSMKAQVLGLEAVLADGSVLDRMHGPAKDNSGYDLPALLAGSEGTLAVVTRVRLRLVPLRRAAVTALVGCPDVDAAVSLVEEVRAHVPSLRSAELMLADGLDLVRRCFDLPPPLTVAWPVVLLLDCAADTDPTEELVAVLAECHPPDGPDAVIAADPSGRAALWRYREAHSEAVQQAGGAVKLDVGLPPDALGSSLDAVADAVHELDDARLVVFGHLAEGNLHVNVLTGPHRDPATEDAVTDAVLTLVAGLGGSISAEHGVGRAKRAWLPLTRSPADLAAMTAIKKALDPYGLLNPGVLLPD